ncbi:MAG TPA: hypothetical protein VJS43_04565 [Candidatus Acidoferrales bacterium]|jgi:hypothetical protein|nr:hypothetical protein [Candidatus Acidoferrales bacterium]
MLALTDSQLGMLAIAATAVTPSQRGRWLKQIANELDGDRARQQNARRVARCRAPSPSPPFPANPDWIGRRASRP